jgi:hypothetical protein
MIIDCGHGVIRIDIAGDHCHLEVMTPSMAGDDHYNVPAESANVHIDYDQAQLLIAELQKIQKPAGKSKAVMRGLQ